MINMDFILTNITKTLIKILLSVIAMIILYLTVTVSSAHPRDKILSWLNMRLVILKNQNLYLLQMAIQITI